MSRAPIKRKSRDLKEIPVSKIIQNEKNPRGRDSFSPEELASLRNSIATHGVLEPVILQPYDDDQYLLIEGERRWRSAQLEGVKELPAVVVNRMDEHDQVVVMFNIHTQRKGWQVAEELRTIKEIVERNGHLTKGELAKELGISEKTLRDRLAVLGMGDKVVTDIASDRLDYTAALRANEVARTLPKKRPALTERLGGEKAVESLLVNKAKSRKGVGPELVSVKQDLFDTALVPDEAVEEYLRAPEATSRDLRRRTQSLEERRKVEDLSKELQRVTREIRKFDIDVDLEAIPNLRALRASLGTLIDAAQELEQRVVAAILLKDEGDDPAPFGDSA